jgi:mono/diheme cytochrome c family protein
MADLSGLFGIVAAQTADRMESPADDDAKAPGMDASALYRQLCQRCHAASGQGDPSAGFSGIPNFTDRAWQATRSDPQLLQSILDGKGEGMPTFRDRVSAAQAQGLVNHIRGFGPRRPAVARAHRDFEARFRELDEELQALQREFMDLRNAPGTPESPTVVRPPQGASAEREMMLQGAAKLYRRHCRRCHGADGKGEATVRGGPPDFTCRAWQQRQSDAQLLASILDGKEKCMPAFRNRLTEDQAADLIDYIRALLAPRKPSSRRKD